MKKMVTNSLTQNTRAGAKGWLNDTKQYHYFLPAFNTQYPWKDQITREKWIRAKREKKQYAVDCKILISLTMQNTHFKPNKPSEQA